MAAPADKAVRAPTRAPRRRGSASRSGQASPRGIQQVSGEGQPGLVHRRTARRSEQILILSLAIIFAILGFPLHVLWIVAIVLMVFLWAYLAADMAGSRRNGGMISDVVTMVGDEVHHLANNAPGPEPSPDADPQGSADPQEPVDPQLASDRSLPADDRDGSSPNGREPTKKDLYDEARKAGIEGRSNMNKDELLEALDD
jgi:hypothetical protein